MLEMPTRQQLGSAPRFGVSHAQGDKRDMPNLVEDMPQTAPARETTVAKRRSRVKIVIPVVLLLAAAGATAAYFHFQDRVSTDDATVEGHVSAIAPKISGNVIEVLVRDNQPV